MGSPNSLFSTNTFPYNRVIDESVITLGHILLSIDNSCQKGAVILPKRNNTSEYFELDTFGLVWKCFYERSSNIMLRFEK